MGNSFAHSIARRWAHRLAKRGRSPVGVRVGDAQSWYHAWSVYADRLYDLAVKLYAMGHRVSACNAFLRASNYYRTAYNFMFALPVDRLVIEGYEKRTDSFQKAAALFEQPIEILKIPYQNTTLPGYLIKADAGNTARKTLLCTGVMTAPVRNYFSALQVGR